MEDDKYLTPLTRNRSAAAAICEALRREGFAMHNAEPLLIGGQPVRLRVRAEEGGHRIVKRGVSDGSVLVLTTGDPGDVVLCMRPDTLRRIIDIERPHGGE